MKRDFVSTMTSDFATTAPPDDLIKPHELAQRLGVSPRTVAYWTKNGKLPCLRLGRRVYYDWIQVRAHMQMNSTDGGDAGKAKGNSPNPNGNARTASDEREDNTFDI